MKEFKVLFLPALISAMCLALFAQEPQGRGGQVAPAPDGATGARGVPGVPAPDGAAGPRGGQGAPAPGSAAGARGGQRGGTGGGPPAGSRGGGGKNVQVLGGADIPSTMQSFVAALGLLEK